VSYEDYGSGPIALLIHGSPGNGKAWQRVGERLAARHRVIAPDLPGHGPTTPPPAESAPDPAYAAELIEELVRAAGRPAVVAGHSYGGVVALTLALRARVPVDALVLFEPVAVPMLLTAGDIETYRASNAFFEGYVASVEGGDAQAVRGMVDYWFGPGAFARLPDPLRDFMVKGAIANIRDIRATLAQRYAPEALRGLAAPVTTVFGGRSPDVTRRIADAIAAHVRRGSVVRLDTANHALITTHVAEVAELIEAAAGPQPSGPARTP
jgi:pimeloyl-ACP methyl ester carboxylesterase